MAHVIALICGDVLKDLKSGTALEAKKLLDTWETAAQGKPYNIPFEAGRSMVIKVRLTNLWALRSAPQEQDFKLMPKTTNRKPIYDVDTRWNSALDMLL